MEQFGSMCAIYQNSTSNLFFEFIFWLTPGLSRITNPSPNLSCIENARNSDLFTFTSSQRCQQIVRNGKSVFDSSRFSRLFRLNF